MARRPGVFQKDQLTEKDLSERRVLTGIPISQNKNKNEFNTVHP